MHAHDILGSSQTEIPKRGLAGLRQNWKADLLSGFTVSLIALPLCLGISLASGVPPVAGLFTAIIGGMIASRLAGSHITISGPAAGLIATTLAAVESLGGGDHAIGYPYALAAIVIAGGFVMLMSLLRVGRLGDFFPSAAVHGMLAAIGIIIIVKQAYVAMGVPAPKGEWIDAVMQLPAALMAVNPEILVIACISLAILIIYPMIENKWIKRIPAPMWVLLMTIPLSFAFDLFDEHHYHFAGNDYVIGPKYLVNLPGSLGDAVVFPDFGKAATGAFWVAVMSFALISGLESMLSAKAVDTLDPWKRKSNLNRDLFAMGAGSSLSSVIGGLPMISEIVRSSANINNGGRTQWANFFHGLFLLLFLLLLKPVIMMIPLSALAAMLIFTGFRLASPREFHHMWQIGWKQLAVFLVTIIVVLLTDLLIGVAAGILMELILDVASGAKLSSLLKARVTVSFEDDRLVAKLHEAVVFSNYLSLKKQITKYIHLQHVVLDFASVRLIDHTVMANLHDLQADFRSKGKTLEFVGMEKLSAVTSHPLAPRVKLRREVSLLSNLSRRQLELMVYALQNRYDFLPEEWEEHEHWQGFPSTDGRKIERVTSVFVKKGNGTRLTVADLRLSSGALLTLESYDTTLMRINFKHRTLPKFILTRETAMDKFAEALGAQDIDFEAHPVFSKKFLLKGEDEKAIRDFFRPEIIHLHEENPGLCLECRGDALLVYSARGLATQVAIEEMLAFGKQYCELALQPETV
jgi:MFS superfamily sulfate permease-like transporter